MQLKHDRGGGLLSCFMHWGSGKLGVWGVHGGVPPRFVLYVFTVSPHLRHIEVFVARLLDHRCFI